MCARLLPLLLGLCGMALPPPAAAIDARVLAPEVEQALRRERVPLAAVSVLVQEVGSGLTRVTLNAHQPVNPA